MKKKYIIAVVFILTVLVVVLGCRNRFTYPTAPKDKNSFTQGRDQYIYVDKGGEHYSVTSSYRFGLSDAAIKLALEHGIEPRAGNLYIGVPQGTGVGQVPSDLQALLPQPSDANLSLINTVNSPSFVTNPTPISRLTNSYTYYDLYEIFTNNGTVEYYAYTNAIPTNGMTFEAAILYLGDTEVFVNSKANTTALFMRPMHLGTNKGYTNVIFDDLYGGHNVWLLGCDVTRTVFTGKFYNFDSIWLTTATSTRYGTSGTNKAYFYGTYAGFRNITTLAYYFRQTDFYVSNAQVQVVRSADADSQNYSANFLNYGHATSPTVANDLINITDNILLKDKPLSTWRVSRP